MNPGKRNFRAGKGRKSPAGLTEMETEIMLVLWEQGPSTVAAVRDELAPSRPLAHTTIITVLDRMCGKGLIRQVKRQARSKVYAPVLERTTVADRLLDNVRRRFFEGSSATMLAHLLKSGEVDRAELEELRRLLDQTDGD
jgi:predicted transcriptional regulator